MVNETGTTQQILDSTQYQIDTILWYEKIYGENFVSPGGYDVAVELLSRLKLDEGARVLDVGCGLGGSAFVMAREFGLQVDGIDLSKNMLSIANQKLLDNGLSNKVNLFWGDCLDYVADNTYDAIYSRDVFLHIHDKQRLFAVLFKQLRSGGQLLFTDYCGGAKPWSDEFSEYVRVRNYDLHSVEEYADIISSAGFAEVVGEDVTARFADILQTEKERIKELDLELAERVKLEQSWHEKQLRALAREQCWGVFSALKG